MSMFGDFSKGSKKKLSKEEMARRAQKAASAWSLPQVEIIGKKKK